MIEEFSDVNAYIHGELDTGMGTVPFAIPEQLLGSSGGLTRERIRSHELGYFGELFQRRLQLDMRFFYDEVEELITQVTHQNKPIALLDNDVIDFAHTDRARVKGLETQLDWRPSTHSMVRFGHAYIEIDSEDFRENYSTSAPRNSYLLFASHRFPGHLDASLAYHYTDSMEWLEWHTIDDVSRLDLRVAKGFGLPGYDAQLALVTQNVLGSHVEFRRGNLFEARAFVQLSLTPR
jgi:iron complex outermembrane receptor protein